MKGRRHRGEGAIHRRGSGLFVGRVSLGFKSDGRRWRAVVYGRSRDEVVEKMAAKRVEHAHGTLVETEPMTIATWLKRWLEHGVRQSVRPSTLSLYTRVVDTFIVPAIGRTRLSTLRASDVDRMMATTEEGGASGRMRQIVLAVLNQALRKAVRQRVIPVNCCDAIDRPRAARREIRPLTADEIRTFLKAAYQAREYALFVLAIATGMRQGELLALQWAEVDLPGASVSVRYTLSQTAEGGLERAETKTRAGVRKIELPQMAVTALLEHKARLLKRGRRASVWVFPDRKGGPIRKDNLVRSFQAVLTKAELPKIRFHDLRHTAATLMLSAGVHPKVVQERLGHSKIAVTLDTYSHVLPTMQRDAAERVNALLS